MATKHNQSKAHNLRSILRSMAVLECVPVSYTDTVTCRRAIDSARNRNKKDTLNGILNFKVIGSAGVVYVVRLLDKQ